ncbi:hypothetical protein JMJ55_26195 [Belnapia sp. T6]|uniref:Uncharacterized protein n=1 Tax=Belnapia mucosa TaxID=2804532 RepID=A0ABS1VBX9_9PROT|nr:hypothetical protein [Belnapia mucosa]MBL6458827.1 hypothetical protein [Belnapia mucosa]
MHDLALTGHAYDSHFAHASNKVMREAALPANEKLIHLRYTTLSNVSSIDFTWQGSDFQLVFEDSSIETGKSYLIKGPVTTFIPTELLLWLSVFVGEDAVDPHREKDTRLNRERGSFKISQKQLATFLFAAERMEQRKWPRWRRELFRNALIYYSVGVRSGVDMMPLNIGFFGLSLECIGNVRHGTRDKHYTLGDKRFKDYLTTRLARAKRDPAKRLMIKDFEKKFNADIDLINQMRNAFYGHSLLHLKDDRKRLLYSLRQWMTRGGHTCDFVNISFTLERLRDQVVTHSPALYKVGLRVNRIFLFLSLGIHKSIPFAEYDFQTVGDTSTPFVGEFRGMRVRFS